MKRIHVMEKETNKMMRRVSQSQCRNILATVIILILLVYYYLPTLTIRFRNLFKDDDKWKMYPRRWVQLEDAPHHYPSFTFTTYNILNDGFLRKYQHKNYPSCTEESLDVTYRQSHILKEIRIMDSDIVCLEEIDQNWYDNYWYSQMSVLGYYGALGVDQSHPLKVGQAIFWKKNKFQLLNQEQHLFHDLAKPYIENTMKGKEAAEFSNWLKHRNLILITHLQEVNSGSKVIVGCVHISAAQYSEPAMQAFQVSLAIQILQSIAQTSAIGTTAFLLTGDFNTPPTYPAYELLKTAKLTENMKASLKKLTNTDNIKPEWKTFPTDVVNILPGAAFTHSLNLASAYSTIMHGEPSTTCKGDKTLDYIWYTTNSLGVAGVLAEPNNSQIIQQHTKESCYIFPSDHIPIQAKLYFIPSKTNKKT